MIDVIWLEQRAADLPPSMDWLSAAEKVRLSSLRIPKRRADWMLGRWTAKRAVAGYLGLGGEPSAQIEIRSEPGGAPRAFVNREPAPLTISISHRDGRAVCAVAAPEAALGCDLEIAEPRSSAFAADYFTPAEQRIIARVSGLERWRLLALLWSAKESVMKLLRVGLRIDPGEIMIETAALPDADFDWLPLRAGYGGHIYHGWWQQAGAVISTIVADPAPGSPRK